MLKFKMTCPDCSATVVTSLPEALVWERCPSCGRHIWDQYDALMADIVAAGNHSAKGSNAHSSH